MDAFSIAGGIASFIGLVGQAAQGIQFLLQVIDDFQDAPKMIVDLRKQLGHLHSVLQYIESESRKNSAAPLNRSITDGVKICSDQVKSLTDLIAKHDFLKNRGGTKRAWKQFLASSKKAKFLRLLDDIQSTKSSLSLAFQAHDYAREGFQGDLMKAWKEEQNLESKKTHRLLQHISDTLSVNSGVVETTLSTAQRAEEGVLNIHGSLDNIQHTLAHLPEAIRVAIQSGIEQSIPQDTGYPTQVAGPGFHKRIRSSTPSDWSAGETLVATDSDPLKGFFQYEESKVSTRYVPIGRNKGVQKRKLPTPLGMVYVTTTTATIFYKDTIHQVEGEFLSYTVNWKFTPFPWISIRSLIASYRSEPCLNDTSLVRSLNFRYFHMVSYQSELFSRCSARDWKGVKRLIERGEATPLDVLPDGASLIDCAVDPRVRHTTEESLELMDLLVKHGADPSTIMPNLLEKVKSNHDEWETGRPLDFSDSWKDDREVKELRVLSALGMVCLDKGKKDPFEDPRLLLGLWDMSLSRCLYFGFDLDLYVHQKWFPLDELAFQYPDIIFGEIVQATSKEHDSFEDDFRKRHDFRFEALRSLCLRGIKHRIYSSPPPDPPASYSGKSTFCTRNRSHLLFQALSYTTYWDEDISWRSMVRDQLLRTLVLLLRHGEDPYAHCLCFANENTTGPRCITPTSVAAENGLLHIWKSALREAGFDDAAVTDEWYFRGIRDLLRLSEKGRNMRYDEEEEEEEEADVCTVCLENEIAMPRPSERKLLGYIKASAGTVISGLSYII
jgi:hypothetical protein